MAQVSKISTEKHKNMKNKEMVRKHCYIILDKKMSKLDKYDIKMMLQRKF